MSGDEREQVVTHAHTRAAQPRTNMHTRTSGGTRCVRGSEGLEDVAVVWLCLVRSLDRWLGFLVVDTTITSLARRFLLAPTVPRGDGSEIRRLAFRTPF